MSWAIVFFIVFTAWIEYTGGTKFFCGRNRECRCGYTGDGDGIVADCTSDPDLEGVPTFSHALTKELKFVDMTGTKFCRDGGVAGGDWTGTVVTVCAGGGGDRRGGDDDNAEKKREKTTANDDEADPVYNHYFVEDKEEDAVVGLLASMFTLVVAVIGVVS